MDVCVCRNVHNYYNTIHDAAVFSFLTGLQVNKNMTNKFSRQKEHTRYCMRDKFPDLSEK